MDGNAFCECAGCQAIYDQYPGETGQGHAAALLYFMNAFAAEAKVLYPDLHLLTLIRYAGMNWPPGVEIDPYVWCVDVSGEVANGNEWVGFGWDEIGLLDPALYGQSFVDAVPAQLGDRFYAEACTAAYDDGLASLATADAAVASKRYRRTRDALLAAWLPVVDTEQPPRPNVALGADPQALRVEIPLVLD